MNHISLPKPMTFESSSPSQAKLVIEPLYPGYGTTLGNLIRRVLLSSLDGVAVSAIKISGIDHEYTTVDHIKEDVVEILQNIKLVRLKANQDLTEPVIMTLNVTGEKQATAGDIETPSEVEVVNKDQVIATLTDAAAKLEMELHVAQGIGYVTADQHEREDKDIGLIDVDSIYTPIVKIGLDVSNVRVGKMTNYEKLELNIETDGTRTPEEAVHEGLDIIRDQLNFLKEGKAEEDAPVVKAAEEVEETEPSKEETETTPEETKE